MRVLVTGGSGFIGTNFISLAHREGHDILDLSNTSCLDPSHQAFWQEQDLLDQRGLTRRLTDFAPDWVVHLGARAECDENTTVEAGYSANTVGTQNLLEAVRQTPTVQRLIVTSTQYVCAPGRLPDNDEHYFPCTVYGQSKVETERITRAADLGCCWTITRPTNVWGPWHLRYRREFWRIAARGLYFHPGGQPIVRSYGYVGNVAHQMMNILRADREAVDRQTFYLGDAPADIYQWTNAFSVALRGRPAPRIPLPILNAAARIGDGISYVRKKPFYIHSSRLRSMTTHYDTPMEKTFEVLGKGLYSLQQGVEETAQWLREYEPPSDAQTPERNE